MHFDIIVIGGGILGCATGYYLQKWAPQKKIAIVEQYQKPGTGNTSKSAALFRNLFGSETSRILANSSIKFYQSISDSVKLHDYGYLWLFSYEDWRKVSPQIKQWDREEIQYEIISQTEIPQFYSIQNSSDSSFPNPHKGIFGKNCGAISAPSLTHYYAHAFQKLGGQIFPNTKICQFQFNHDREFNPSWKDVHLQTIMDQKGTKYTANEYVFTVGAWSHEILTQLGIGPHIYPKRRQLFSFKIASHNSITTHENPPALILPVGNIYLKPINKGKMFVAGGANHLGNPFIREEEEPEGHPTYFRKVILPILKHYFPKVSFELYSQWAGYYAYHWPDANPVIERIKNIVWSSGTSGSGIMKADAIGRITAAKIFRKDEVLLFSDIPFRVSDLSLTNRRVKKEFFII